LDHQSDILIQLLLRFERISFNGVGTLYLVRKSAAFENHRGLLSPPSEFLAFSDEDDKRFELSTLAAGFRPEDIHFQQMTASLSKQLTELLSSEGRTDLSGIGTVIKTATGFMFTPAAEKFDGQFWGLPVLDVSAVPLNHKRNNSGESNPISKPVQPLHFAEEKQSTGYFIWPLAAILLTIALLSLRYLNCSPEKNQNESAAVTQIEPASDSVKGTTPADTSNESPETPADSTDSSQKEAADDTLDVKAFDGECIIIVGSFSRKSNADRMMKRVSEAGYKAYLGRNNGMVRVGMTFECNREDLTDSMKSMRGKFTKDAWYLKPEVRIEN
jgi:cell division septation protein DedD